MLTPRIEIVICSFHVIIDNDYSACEITHKISKLSIYTCDNFHKRISNDYQNTNLYNFIENGEMIGVN